MKLLGVVHTDPFGEQALLNAIQGLQVDWVSFELLDFGAPATLPSKKNKIPDQIINAVTSSADDIDIDLFKSIWYMYNFETRVRDNLKEKKVDVINSDFKVPFLIRWASNCLLAASQRDKRCIVGLSKESRTLLDTLYDAGLSNRSAFFVAVLFETTRSKYGDIVGRDYHPDQYHTGYFDLAMRYRDYRTATKLRKLVSSNPNGLHVCGLAHIFGNHKNLAKRLSHLKPSLHLLSDFH